MAISLEVPMKAYTRGATKLVSAHTERKTSHETEEREPTCQKLLKMNQDTHTVHAQGSNLQALRMQCPVIHHPKTHTNIHGKNIQIGVRIS